MPLSGSFAWHGDIMVADRTSYKGACITSSHAFGLANLPSVS